MLSLFKCCQFSVVPVGEFLLMSLWLSYNIVFEWIMGEISKYISQLLLMMNINEEQVVVYIIKQLFFDDSYILFFNIVYQNAS